MREIEHASSVRCFAADLNIELIFSRVERILEINELHTVTTEVVEEASRRVAKPLVYCDKQRTFERLYHVINPISKGAGCMYFRYLVRGQEEGMPSPTTRDLRLLTQ